MNATVATACTPLPSSLDSSFYHYHDGINKHCVSCVGSSHLMPYKFPFNSDKSGSSGARMRRFQQGDESVREVLVRISGVWLIGRV